jgi:WD40 repeat protein
MNESRKVKLKLDEELIFPTNFFKFSPQKTYLAQFSSQSSAFYETKPSFVYLYKLDSLERFSLGQLSGFFYYFKFSADERFLIFARNSNNQQTEICIFDVAEHKFLKSVETPPSKLISDWQASADDQGGYLQCNIFLQYFGFEVADEGVLKLRTLVGLTYGPDGGPSPNYGSCALYHATYRIEGDNVERMAEWLKDVSPHSIHRCDENCRLLSFGKTHYDFSDLNTKKLGELSVFSGEIKDIIADAQTSKILIAGVADESQLTIYDFSTNEVVWRREFPGERIRVVKFLGDSQTVSVQAGESLYLFTDGVKRQTIRVPPYYYSVAAVASLREELLLVTNFEQRFNFWRIAIDADEAETEIVYQTIKAARQAKEMRLDSGRLKSAGTQLFKDWWWLPLIIGLTLYFKLCN